jgi:hypothetical protein
MKRNFTLMIGSSLLVFLLLSGILNNEIAQADTDAALYPHMVKISGKVVYSSPVIADINNDGLKEIIVGTEAGYLSAVRYNNNGSFTKLWETNLGSAIGSSPAVGDVDGDGDLEIVVGVGWSPASQAGGIVLLNHNGVQLWRKQTGDRNGGPNGIPDGVFGTPALGDLNNNGKLEIVVAGFDENIYVLDAQGNNLPGWPFWMQDNTWGSPALGDMDGDGHLDIIVGSYANKHATSCPDYACGRVFVLNYQGQPVTGWPRIVDSHLDSSPLVFDLDNDGKLEIVVGSGQNSSLPSRFNKVYAFEANGSFMNGWPVQTGGFVFSSPAAADIDKDGDYEVFVGAADGKLYGWSHTGQSLPGWPVTPLNQNGTPQPITTASSPTIVDADGDGQLDIFIAYGWDIVGFKKSGTPLGDSYRFKTWYSLGATPAWGDIDNDGLLEVTIANAHYSDVDAGFGRINVWDLNTNATKDGLAWSMWRMNMHRNALGKMPSKLSVPTSSLVALTETNSRSNIFFFFDLVNTGDDTLSYTIVDNASNVSVYPANGTLNKGEQEITVTIDTTTLGSAGTYEYTLTIQAKDEQDRPVPGSPTVVPVKIVVVEEIFKSYLPMITKSQ